MSKGAWFREKKKTTTITLPLTLYRQGKLAGLNFSRLTRIAAIRALKQEDSFEAEMLKFHVRMARMGKDNQNLRQRLYELEESKK